jgi:hypothetical protein
MSHNAKSVKSPYCKVCFDAGKPESEYTSHWVRTLPDRSGKTIVTCPTLLNTECRYCNQSGHTIKFCKLLEKQNKNMERAAKVEAMNKANSKKETPKQKKTANTFAVLCEDSDTEDEDTIKYPLLKKIDIVVPNVKSESKTAAKSEMKMDWAAIVAKPPQVKKVEPVKQTGLVLISDFIKDDVKMNEKKIENKPAPWAKKTAVVTRSWADESDSEDSVESDDTDYDTLDAYNPTCAEYVDETW